MSYMFYRSQFNGDISNWNVSNVEYTESMFFNSKFTDDISKWDLSNVEDIESISKDSPSLGYMWSNMMRGIE